MVILQHIQITCDDVSVIWIGKLPEFSETITVFRVRFV